MPKFLICQAELKNKVYLTNTNLVSLDSLDKKLYPNSLNTSKSLILSNLFFTIKFAMLPLAAFE